ncbi:hypothetical protein KQ878_03705, partial [Mycoplasma zalophidermidis]
MSWIAWNRKKYAQKNKVQTFSHNIMGKKILAYHNRRDIRPLVVFYNGNEVYFLNSRSVTQHNNKIKGEVKAKFSEKLKESFIDTSSIQVMNSKEFFKIYKNDQFNPVYQLNNKDAKNVINALNDSLESDHLTIQRISINDKYESVSEVLFSTKIKNDLPLNKSFNENYLVQTNEAVATVLHLRALIKHLKVMDDEELTNYRNAENVDEYMYKNYNGY